jgi:hypothetical protein
LRSIIARSIIAVFVVSPLLVLASIIFGSDGKSASASTITTTYSVNSSIWTVPFGVTSMTVTARGGAGGTGGRDGGDGGGGASIVTNNSTIQSTASGAGGGAGDSNKDVGTNFPGFATYSGNFNTTPTGQAGASGPHARTQAMEVAAEAEAAVCLAVSEAQFSMLEAPAADGSAKVAEEPVEKILSLQVQPQQPTQRQIHQQELLLLPTP